MTGISVYLLDKVMAIAGQLTDCAIFNPRGFLMAKNSVTLLAMLSGVAMQYNVVHTFSLTESKTNQAQSPS